MHRIIIILCTGLQTLLFLSSDAELDGLCTQDGGRRNVLKLSFDRRLNDSDGQWTTTFSARRKDSVNSSAALKIDTTHSTVECDENREFYMEIIVKEEKDLWGAPAPGYAESIWDAGQKDGGLNQAVIKKSKEEDIFFHHRHNRNVVLFNGGKSAQKIDLGDLFFGGVFTNRPLKDNEIFEVRLDMKSDEKNYCHGIGVMAHSPDEVKFYDSMYKSKGTWILYGTSVYGEDKNLIPNYASDTCKTKVGETIGVMKRGNGSLHFFVNGVDQGPAITNAPSIVYGVYEVRGFAIKATIVSQN